MPMLPCRFSLFDACRLLSLMSADAVAARRCRRRAIAHAMLLDADSFIERLRRCHLFILRMLIRHSLFDAELAADAADYAAADIEIFFFSISRFFAASLRERRRHIHYAMLFAAL